MPNPPHSACRTPPIRHAQYLRGGLVLSSPGLWWCWCRMYRRSCGSRGPEHGQRNWSGPVAGRCLDIDCASAGASHAALHRRQALLRGPSHRLRPASRRERIEPRDRGEGYDETCCREAVTCRGSRSDRSILADAKVLRLKPDGYISSPARIAEKSCVVIERSPRRVSPAFGEEKFEYIA